ETLEIPYETSAKIEPVYRTFKGWNCDLGDVRSYDEFPSELKAYVEYIEKETGVHIGIVSVGPDRSETILR
ncbi:MAG: adenylosuccinate synthetase, partial [Mucinivorans sp.]